MLRAPAPMTDHDVLILSAVLGAGAFVEAVAGFGALPEALAAVSEGRVSGKIAIYPGRLDLPVTRIAGLRPAAAGRARWTPDDERRLVEG